MVCAHIFNGNVVLYVVAMLFSEALHQDLMRMGLAPDKSLADVRKMPAKYQRNREIMQATRVVRFPEFYEQTMRVFAAIADVMQTLPNKTTVLFIERNKSNEWMALLFMDFLMRVGMNDLFSRIRLSSDARTTNEILVFLDDGTYSGTQMADYLSRLLPNVDQSLVIVGIPFATHGALQRIRRALTYHSERLSAMILYSDIMTPIGDNDLGTKPAIYFDHKVPDSWSTYTTYDMYLSPAVRVPFYKEPDWNPRREPPRVSLNLNRISTAHAITIEQH